jgi:hypothetical protein
LHPEDVFRNANDSIAQTASELGWRYSVPFLCECSDRHCFARLELTLAEYEEARLHPQRYLTAPQHQVAGAFVIEQGERVALAEKLYAGA